MIRWQRVIGAALPLMVSFVVLIPAARADGTCPVADPTCLVGSAGQTVGGVGQGVGQTVDQTVGSVGHTVDQATTTVAKTVQSTTKVVGDTVGQLTGEQITTGGNGGQSGTPGGGTGGQGGTGIGGVTGGAAPTGPGTSGVRLHLRGAHGHGAQVVGVVTPLTSDSLDLGASHLRRSLPGGGSFIHRVLPAAAGLALLLILIGLAVAFLSVQDRIDRRDPRLAPAYLGSDRVSFR